MIRDLLFKMLYELGYGCLCRSVSTVSWFWYSFLSLYFSALVCFLNTLWLRGSWFLYRRYKSQAFWLFFLPICYVMLVCVKRLILYSCMFVYLMKIFCLFLVRVIIHFEITLISSFSFCVLQHFSYLKHVWWS